MEDKVSVILPVYNCEQYIEKCLDSILQQSYENLEVIIINDGSRDGTDKVIKKYIHKDRRVKYFIQENAGPSLTRNRAIEKATGKYIVFVDSDDRVSNLYVEKLVGAIKTNNCDIACCGYVDESKYGIFKLNDFWKNKNILHKEEFIKCVCSGVGGVLWGKIFKREIIQSNELRMDPNIYMSEDLVFILDYCKYIDKAEAINENLYYYNRFNENSISSNISIKYLENYKLLLTKIQKLLNDLNIESDYINEVSMLKIRALLINVIEGETIRYVKNKNYKIFRTNIETVINDEIVEKYIEKFYSEDKVVRLKLNLIIRKKYRRLLYVSILNIKLKQFKDYILRR